MELDVVRFASNNKATIGAFYIDGDFKCFTIEDERRTMKVFGETRIPEGTYDVTLRKEGSFHNRYKAKFPKFHKGMLCIHNASNYKIINNGMEFQYVLFHIGNTEKDTAGCILWNYTADALHYKGGNSTNAYIDLYPVIADHLEKGGKVTLEISNLFDE